MQDFILKLTCLGLIILCCFGIYYGSWLPYMKAETMKVVPGGSLTVQNVIDTFEEMRKTYSPIGNDESITQILTLISSLVNQPQGDSGISVEKLADYGESILKYTDPNSPAPVLWMGNIYRILWKQYHNQSDLMKLRYYNEKLLNISPYVISKEALDSY